MRIDLVAVVALATGCAFAYDASASGDLVFNTVRADNPAGLHSLLADGRPADQTDESGRTPLMMAALAGSEECMVLLLEHGADPNAQSKSGLTAMMWAVHEEGLVHVLLRQGADPNLVSKLENSPLIVAARIPGNHRTVRLLLENGAIVNHENFCGVQALQTAAASGDVKSVKLLVEQGAEVNHIPTNEKGFGLLGRGISALMWAANLGDLPMARLLVSEGADVNLEGERGMTPLALAAMHGRNDIARLLLQHGADVNKTGSTRGPSSFPPLMWAASEAGSERGALVGLLLKHGADAKGRYSRRDDSFMEIPQTPLLWADRHGDHAVLKRLTEAGATRDKKSYLKEWLSKPSDTSLAKVTTGSIKSSIGRAVPLLETSALDSFEDFVQRGQRCISCHQQMIPQLALSDVRNAGLATSNDNYSRIVDLIKDRSTGLEKFMEQPTFHPGASMSIGYFFRSLMAADVPADIGTDIRVHVLASMQTPEGYWRDTSLRQPIQSSDVAGTALAIRGLQTYPIPGREDEFNRRITRAVNWLRTAPIGDNEDRAYQLMGLAWAGQSGEQLSPVVRGLLDKQRANGGWAQLDSLESDAYATGQSLYALITAGGLQPDPKAIERGLQFLLSTQTPKGSWHVRRRAYPFQPTFDGAFPHGRDTWISAAATSWAVMSMSRALQSMPGDNDKLLPPEGAVVANDDPTGPLPEPAVGQFDFEQDIRPLLEDSCLDCHGGAGRARSGLKMHNREALLSGGRSKDPGVNPGHSASSTLIRYAAGLEEDLEMPPVSKRESYPPWTNDQIALLRAWIDQGAEWPDAVELE